MPPLRRLALLAALLLPGTAMAQMDMSWMAMDGAGSGTARLPATEAMHGVHIMPGAHDMVMLHASILPVYTDQGGPRGGQKFYAQSMAMGMWVHDLGDGAKLTGQAMLSLEPAMRHDGYPLLFATGEEAYGRALVDRQHRSSMAGRWASPRSARRPSCTAPPRSITPKRRSPTTGSIRRISRMA